MYDPTYFKWGILHAALIMRYREADVKAQGKMFVVIQKRCDKDLQQGVSIDGAEP